MSRHPYTYRQLLTSAVVPLVLMSSAESVWSADEGALVFASAQRAVVRISVRISQEQLESEQARLLEQAGKELYKLNELGSRFRKEASEAVPIGEEDENLREEDEYLRSFMQFMDRWQEGWKQRINALREQGTEPRQVGMGVIIDPSGIVLTCYSAIKSVTGTVPFTVLDYAGRSFDADVYAFDEATNIALLRIAEDACSGCVDIPSEEIRPLRGSDVFAIQSAYGLEPSPVRGMVGNYNVTLGTALLERYIQLQLEMFPGNFGAPVFTSDGKLLGILAGDYPANVNPKITCAIPQSMLADVAPDLIAYRYRPRGAIGVDLTSLTITGVHAGSAAERGGLIAGDELVAVDSRTLDTYRDLLQIVDKTRPGQKVVITVKRNNNLKQIRVTLGIYGAPPSEHEPTPSINLNDPSPQATPSPAAGTLSPESGGDRKDIAPLPTPPLIQTATAVSSMTPNDG